jgi:hypothetical protein
LRGEETRRLIDAGGVVDETYASKRKLKAQDGETERNGKSKKKTA